MSSSLCLLLLSVCVLFTCFSAQRSCRARCGDTYSRSSECQCDYECLSHNECCKNYESVCTARGSCKGRCGEHFKRRRHCHCDIDCIKYNQCCPDYESQCATEDSSMEEEYGEFEVTTALDNTLTDGITDSSIMTPDKSPKGTQDNFEAEQLSPNNSVPIFHQASTMLTVNQQPSGRCATTTKPNDDTSASQQTDTNAETTAPITTEHKSTRAYNNPEISPSTAISTQIVTEQKRLSNNASLLIVSPEIASVRPSSTAASKSSTTFTLSTSEPEPTASSATAPANYTDLQPSNPVRSEDTQNQEHENQTESSNNTTSERPEIRTMFSTDKASIGTTTATQTENQDVKSILSTKDSLTYSASVKRTLASLTVSTSSTQVEEIPTKPMDDKTKLQDLQDYQADANSDTNLCRGRPVNGLTTIKNGTIVVFRGNYFWMLDSRRNSGPAHLITDYWGIPSPIDTVFTRCNCHGKTYIFKADKYWRFENDVMDADFPRHITEGFGLDGHVDAALSMPQYRSRRESVLFFKRGGVAQRYSYLNTPNCGSRSTAVIVRKRFRKETDPHLSQEIDTGKTWVGFPKTVTSAVSVRTTGGEGYKYYVFSQKNYYSLKMERDTPVILTPTAGRKKPKSAKSWFSCPETSKM